MPANDTYHIEADVPEGEITAIRLEALTHMSLPLMGPGRSDAAGNFVLSEFELRARPLKAAGSAGTAWQTVKLAAAIADHAQEGFPAAARDRRRPFDRLVDRHESRQPPRRSRADRLPHANRSATRAERASK